MGTVPTAVATAIGNVIESRAEYDRRVGVRTQSEADLLAAQKAKADADTAVAAGDSALNAAIASAASLLESFRPGNTPPLDPPPPVSDGQSG